MSSALSVKLNRQNKKWYGQEHLNRLYERDFGVCFRKNSTDNQFSKWLENDNKKMRGKYGMMGTRHVQTTSGDLVFNLPYAQKNERFPGSVVDKEYKVAQGNWFTEASDGTNAMDGTGRAIVQGNFFDGGAGEHFALGAPSANDFKGRVHVCYNCFAKGRAKDKDFKVDGKETGDQFGAALAAVDIDGDGTDELVIGAPFYSDMLHVSMEI